MASVISACPQNYMYMYQGCSFGVENQLKSICKRRQSRYTVLPILQSSNDPPYLALVCFSKVVVQRARCIFLCGQYARPANRSPYMAANRTLQHLCRLRQLNLTMGQESFARSESAQTSATPDISLDQIREIGSGKDGLEPVAFPHRSQRSTVDILWSSSTMTFVTRYDRNSRGPNAGRS
jgi:hypothetical protein